MGEPRQAARGPLHGYRIVDMTGVIAGPYATQILGDLGADVIKVEGKDGDLMRGAGPFRRHKDMATLYVSINRNKRSIALDLKQASAKRAMHKLVASADAFVTNVRPQGMARLGLDYESLRAAAPKIVYAHLLGFGSGGPYAGRQAYDDLVQAASGMADLLPKTERGGEPRFLPSLFADKVTGLHLVYALIAALLHRERTGEGQLVEVPMLEAVATFNLVEHLYGHLHVPPTGQWGYTRVLTPNRRPFKTKDAFIAIMPYTDQHWPKFFELAGVPELWERWRNASLADRTRHIDELYATIGQVTQSRTTAEWMELLDRHDIPCMRINRLEELQDDPHLRAVGLFEEREHPDEGPYLTLKHPVRFSANDTPLRQHAPRLGADGRELLAEVGLARSEIDGMLAEGALVLPASPGGGSEP
jgi:crotonobetainyl-CoA:carnitine CoA-transferase CaiB-like acyl-CoA transferase